MFILEQYNSTSFVSFIQNNSMDTVSPDNEPLKYCTSAEKNTHRGFV